jgi:hypothetical protein
MLPGQAARGSGALPAFVDIVIEMSRLSRHNLQDRRRRLKGFSRDSATPSKWVIELNEAGTDYFSWGESSEPDFDHGRPVLEEILAGAERKLSRDEILRRWPDRLARPKRSTLWKWLDRLVKEGQVLHDGDGRRSDPLVYMLPGMETQWQEDMLASLVKRWGK